MNKASIYAVVGILVLAIIGAVLIYAAYPRPTVTTLLPAAAVLSETATNDDAAVRSQVIGFGKALRDVSILAPGTEFQDEMESAYGPYVTSQLIGQWELDPAQAIGSGPASPSPDHIDITSSVLRPDGTYLVSGNVVDAANSADTYPVSLVLVSINGTWLIANAGIAATEQTATSTGL